MAFYHDEAASCLAHVQAKLATLDVEGAPTSP
jgi:hypothetical protein